MLSRLETTTGMADEEMNEAAKMRGSASHAATAAAAADLRRFRPSIRIHGLVARLADEYDQNERLASLFRGRCGDASWYQCDSSGHRK